MSERSLTTLQFRGASLAAMAGPTPETTLVAVKSLIDGMGLDWSAQLRRIKRHPVLRTCMVVMAMQVPGDAQAREVVFLALTRIHFFLGTIQPDRVKDAGARAAVVDFQTECADVLFAHFFGRAAAAAAVEATDPELPEAARLRMVTEGRQTWGIDAAQELWRDLKLPMTPSMQAGRRQSHMDDHWSRGGSH